MRYTDGSSNDAGSNSSLSSRRNTIVLTMELAVEIYSQRPIAMLRYGDFEPSPATPSQCILPPIETSIVQANAQLHPDLSREAEAGKLAGGREVRSPQARKRRMSLTFASQQVAARYGVRPPRSSRYQHLCPCHFLTQPRFLL